MRGFELYSDAAPATVDEKFDSRTLSLKPLCNAWEGESSAKSRESGDRLITKTDTEGVISEAMRSLISPYL